MGTFEKCEAPSVARRRESTVTHSIGRCRCFETEQLGSTLVGGGWAFHFHCSTTAVELKIDDNTKTAR